VCGCIDFLPSGFLVILVAMSPPQCVLVCFSLLGFGPKVFVLCVLCIDLLPSDVRHLVGDLASSSCECVFQFV